MARSEHSCTRLSCYKSSGWMMLVLNNRLHFAKFFFRFKTEAVLAGDFSVVPHFYHDPQAGLIHEVRLECAGNMHHSD